MVRSPHTFVLFSRIIEHIGDAVNNEKNKIQLDYKVDYNQQLFHSSQLVIKLHFVVLIATFLLTLTSFYLIKLYLTLFFITEIFMTTVIDHFNHNLHFTQSAFNRQT